MTDNRMFSEKAINRIILGIAIPILLFFASKTFAYNKCLEIKNIFYDNFFKVKYAVNDYYGVKDKDIVILDIDNRSIHELGNFNRLWSRSYFARVIGNIKQDGASAVFLDILFRGVNSDYDNKVLVDSLRSAGNVFLGMYLNLDSSSLKKVPEIVINNPDSDSINHINKKKVDFLSSGSIDFSYHDLVMSSESVGFTNCVPDYDGVLRHLPLLMLNRRLLCSSASMQIWTSLYGLSHTNAKFKPNGIIYSDYYFIPTDHNCYVKVNYQGLKDYFNYYSFVDVLGNNYQKGLFKDKIVMIGSSAGFFGDLKKIPGGIVPGVQVHAAALSMLINGNFMKVTGSDIDLVIAILCGLFSAYLYSGVGLGKTLLKLCLFMLLMVFIALIVFYSFSYFINLTLAIMTITLIALVYSVISFLPFKNEQK
jgi:adenylate cyclase